MGRRTFTVILKMLDGSAFTNIIEIAKKRLDCHFLIILAVRTSTIDDEAVWREEEVVWNTDGKATIW